MKQIIVCLVLFLAAGIATAATGVVDWEYDFVNMRAEPSTTADKIGAISSGVELEIVDQREEWTRVRHPNGEGWIVSRSLKILEPLVQAENNKAQPADIAVESVAKIETEQVVEEPAEPAADPEPPVPPEPPVAPEPEPEIKPQAEAKKADPAVETESDKTAAPIPSGYLADIPQSSPVPQVSLGSSIVSMFAGLMVVLALIAIAVWGARRFFGSRLPGVQGGAAIRLLASKPVGVKQSLLLVEVGGEVMLLSQTENELSMVTKIESATALNRLDYLFEFKPSAFESELRKHVDVEGSEQPQPPQPPQPPADPAVSAKERLDQLRRRPKTPGQQ